ncbi:mannobiose 2-epimerase [Cnuella takakiae]|uniref:Mannobiose 2-epimerase n=1 Tax=Cnuella takakiae TaxID=1302690 RepID=A0A1M5DU23_9BACT|nr:AGE family epimerase/isomerase [Cnuella takakiae]SHF70487.1 mannobiose 2-epimerase [Cnuella takakiae]
MPFPLFSRLVQLALSICFTTQFYSAVAQPGAIPDSILPQMRYAAKEGLLDHSYPRNIDTQYGGYLSTFSYNWQPVGAQDKMIVTQARHIWSTAKATAFYKDERYLPMAKHGYLFLRDRMWDQENGGFHNLVSRDGKVKSDMKEAYGHAFGIYGLAAYYAVSKDTGALGLAKRAFYWLEQHTHDAKAKGYFQNLRQDGKPAVRNAQTPSTSTLGYKDQNSSIHLLEAFTELYHVWPDPLVKTRVQEMLDLLLDKIIQPKGYLQLFLTPEWKPVTFRDKGREGILQHRNVDHVSFGHDVETAYLMMEASEAVGNYRHADVLRKGKEMVDHSLRIGWDKALGGFYDQGYYFPGDTAITIIKDSKNWWAQAEGLNTLLICSRLYPDDPLDYAGKFVQLWQYAQTYLIDHQYGDWYEEGLDKEPERRTGNKAHIWKATYHNFRSLSNCIKILEARKG